MSKLHVPVMLSEVIDYLNLAPGATIVDATIGTGGHSLEILKRITPGGRLVGIDRDEESLKICQERLGEFSGCCEFVHGNFADLGEILKKMSLKKVNGILFDLGISSFQLDDPLRGFSFQKDGPLDMRLDRSSYISAYDLVNNLNEEEISTLLWNFGQERWHNRIAHLLVQEREKQPISTTLQLANIVIRSIPYRYRHRHYRIHPATRSFQAVRIAVNRELEILDGAIDKAIAALEIKGRVCVISFHSLEDRAAKFGFRRAQAENLVEIITPKPKTALFAEQANNPSSRSSKLRVAEKL
ncbi:MAG: 16S rRNA (cytosine(1402)-N(4))-methyltransferase RsmH [Candidatus Omnitrophota bacterium]